MPFNYTTKKCQLNEESELPLKQLNDINVEDQYQCKVVLFPGTGSLKVKINLYKEIKHPSRKSLYRLNLLPR